MVYLYRAMVTNNDHQLEKWIVETDVMGLVKQSYNIDRQQYWVCSSYDNVSKLDSLTPISLPMYVNQVDNLPERILVTTMLYNGGTTSSHVLAVAGNLYTSIKKLYEDLLDPRDIINVLTTLLELDKVSIAPSYTALTSVNINGVKGVLSIIIPKHAKLDQIIPGWVKDSSPTPQVGFNPPVAFAIRR